MSTTYETELSRKTAQAQAELELNCLIGMSDAKQFVSKLAAFYKTEVARERLTGSRSPVPLHLALTGPPGVGKTTLARIIVKLLYGYGVLRTDTFIECDRNALVGKYVGSTAPKTTSLLNNARGGALFIDEAYSLANHYEGDFGREAIHIINKYMEDHRDDIMLVVAGYKDEMNKFFSLNPGLMSRFKWRIDLPDYDPHTLCRILDQFAWNDGWQLTPAAKARTAILLHLVWANRKPDFANARTVRCIWESTFVKQGHRLNGNVTRQNHKTVTELDIPTEEFAPSFDFAAAEAKLSWKSKCPKCSRQFVFSVEALANMAQCRCGKMLTLPWWSIDFESAGEEFSSLMAQREHAFSPDVALLPSTRPRGPTHTPPISVPSTELVDDLTEPPDDPPSTPPPPSPPPARITKATATPTRSDEHTKSTPSSTQSSGLLHLLVLLCVVLLLVLTVIANVPAELRAAARACAIICPVNVACILAWVLFKPAAAYSVV